MDANQKKFIVEHFFPVVSADSRNIAQSLVGIGEVITTVDKLWTGGIGNFISSSPAEGTVGCYKMTFHREEFLKSLWLKETIEGFLPEIQKEIEDTEEELEKLIYYKNSIQEL